MRALPSGTEMVVHDLVRRFRPSRVVLFGSYAYGNPGTDSDIDLLVVTSNPPERSVGWDSARALRAHTDVPVQLVFMTPREFEETRDVIGGLAYPAHHWGYLLYDAHA
ncbi:MAG: nucleotidyltransferase domain-containing protein [Chloroflexi bacterium]|nr:nucleotidyltransferase domain-containing protein [Chloroflexota bacterium]